MVHDGVEDFGEGSLNVEEGLHARKARAEDVGSADDAAGELAALLIAMVEVTESLAAKGGRAARDSIFFEMVADAYGRGYLQFGCQSSAVS